MYIYIHLYVTSLAELEATSRHRGRLEVAPFPISLWPRGSLEVWGGYD